MPLQFGDIYVPENFNSEFAPLKEKIESLINLSRSAGNERRYAIPNNKLMRICLLVGLSTPGKRDEATVDSMKLQQGNRFVPSFFTHQELSPLYSALIKLRYHDSSLDLSNNRVLSRIIGAEMCRGRDLLLSDNNLENYLFSQGGRARLPKIYLPSICLSATMAMRKWKLHSTSTVGRLPMLKLLSPVPQAPAKQTCSQC